ncbi:MAG: putative Ig domain-containing protein, partial [Planctomycetes bacterium]|nr:putative Ig domain-containing protein [Planctomycetota bacterium]
PAPAETTDTGTVQTPAVLTLGAVNAPVEVAKGQVGVVVSVPVTNTGAAPAAAADLAAAPGAANLIFSLSPASYTATRNDTVTQVAGGATATLTFSVNITNAGLPPSPETIDASVTGSDANSGASTQDGAASAIDTWTVKACIVQTTTLPDGYEGVAYSQTLAATGGDGTYTWSLTAGVLPAGLGLNGATGEISGTPTTTSAGSYPITVEADEGTGTDNQALTLVIQAAPDINTASPLPDGEVGVAYSQTIDASGGTTAYTWALAAGTLPSGLSLGTTGPDPDGVVSGTPTAGVSAAAGDFSFTLRSTGANTATNTKVYTMHVVGPLSAVAVSPEVLAVDQPASPEPEMGLPVRFQVTFTCAPATTNNAGGIAGDGRIAVTFPAEYTVTELTGVTFVSCSPANGTGAVTRVGNTLITTFTGGGGIGAGTAVTLTLDNVKNPPAPPVTTGTFAIETRRSTNVVVDRVTGLAGFTTQDLGTWSVVSLGGPPSARRDHTAVWTGKDMIVWGGRDAAGTALDTGSTYDPVFDSWSGLGVVALAARYAHSAVWANDPGEMIVFGGWDGATAFSNGARYNPATGVWTLLPGAGTPSVRREHRAVWTGRYMVVWGGRTAAAAWLNDGSRYQWATDTWVGMLTPTAVQLPNRNRSRHCMVWSEGTGQMVVWGGQIGVASYESNGALYNPTANTWNAAPIPASPLSARASATAVSTGGKDMIVFGGTDGAVKGDGATYDVYSDAWTSLPAGGDAPTARTDHTAVWTGREMIVWGGYDGANRLRTGASYDLEADTWTRTAKLIPSLAYPGGTTPARDSHTAVWTGSEMIVWGGWDGTTAYNRGGRLQPPARAEVWEALGGVAPSARRDHSAVWTGKEVIVWGGRSNGGVTAIGTGKRYDPAFSSWLTMNTFAPATEDAARYGHSTVWTGQLLVLMGGSDIGGAAVDLSIRTYDPGLNSWTDTGLNFNASLSFGGAFWDGNRAVMLGGASADPVNAGGVPTEAGGDLAGIWYDVDGANDGTTNDPSLSIGAFNGRYDHTVTWTGEYAVVYGGRITTASALPPEVAARYDPTANTWLTVTPPLTIGGRYAHSAAWTGYEVIIWGGHNGAATFYGDGERYDPVGNGWNGALPALNAPTARRFHTAVWTGADMIIWGGQDGAGVLGTGALFRPSDDLWTAVTNTGAPAARFVHTATWTGRYMVVFGGSDGAGNGLTTGLRYEPPRP